MPRCCEDPCLMEDEFEPCYASVLVAPGGIGRAVADLESKPIAPCITTWCPTCKRCSLITSAVHHFPCVSAHHAHAVALSGILEKALN